MLTVASFFVDTCHFTGSNDPFKWLKTRAQGGHRHRRVGTPPFDGVAAVRPAGVGKIAVKVINDYGDDVMKVFTV
jgi:adenine-specific DNA-methyltransferase